MGFLDNTGVTRLVTDLKSRFTAPKSIAYVESTTAKTNHSTGDHFMIGEQLKRATSAIATGETIGTTNSADDTVQSQIDTLRDSVGWYVADASQAYTTGTSDQLIRVNIATTILSGYSQAAILSMNLGDRSCYITGISFADGVVTIVGKYVGTETSKTNTASVRVLCLKSSGRE